MGSTSPSARYSRESYSLRQESAVTARTYARNVKNGRAATKEYRACGGSNRALRSRTSPVSPRNRPASDSGVCAVWISWSQGRIGQNTAAASNFSTLRADFSGLTSARLNCSGRINSRAAARTSAGRTSLRRRLTSSGAKIFP